MLILIYGKSGSGKTTALRNLTEKEVCLIGAIKKPLPFKSNIKCRYTDSFQEATVLLQSVKTPILVIDDIQFMSANQYYNLPDSGYGAKYAQMGKDLMNFIKALALWSEKTGGNVYLLWHEDYVEGQGYKAKVETTAIDKHQSIEGYFTLVLRAFNDKNGYYFETQNPLATCKAPMGMFEETKFENDLKMVNEKVIAFYQDDKPNNE